MTDILPVKFHQNTNHDKGMISEFCKMFFFELAMPRFFNSMAFSAMEISPMAFSDQQ